MGVGVVLLSERLVATGGGVWGRGTALGGVRGVGAGVTEERVAIGGGVLVAVAGAGVERVMVVVPVNCNFCPG